LYTRETDEPVKKAVKACNDVWVQYRVVIYSPTIGPGVDFSPCSGPHFDRIFAYGSNASNSARDFCQMIGRVRRLKAREVMLCMEVIKPKHPMECDRGALQAKLEAHCYEILHWQERVLLPVSYNEDGSIQFDNKPYLNLYLWNEREKNLSNRSFTHLVIHALQARGVGIRYLRARDERSQRHTGELVDTVAGELYEQRIHEAATASYGSELERSASLTRMNSNQQLTKDKVLFRVSDLLKKLGIQLCNPVDGVKEDDPVFPLFKHLIRLYYDEHVLAAINLCSDLLKPLAALKDSHTILASQQGVAGNLDLIRDAVYNKAKCFKLVLWIAGFAVNNGGPELDSATALSTNVTTTQSIKQRLQVEGGAEKLQAHKQSLLKCWGIDMDQYTVTTVLRAVTKMLGHFSIVVFPLSGRSNQHGKSWRIRHDHSMSLLELLYARRQAGIARCGMGGLEPLSGELTVTEMIMLHKPKFQWTPLTGTNAPYPDNEALCQWKPEDLKSATERSIEKRQHKRKRNE
jgi:hypothetical protein